MWVNNYDFSRYYSSLLKEDHCSSLKNNLFLLIFLFFSTGFKLIWFAFFSSHLYNFSLSCNLNIFCVSHLLKSEFHKFLSFFLLFGKCRTELIRLEKFNHGIVHMIWVYILSLFFFLILSSNLSFFLFLFRFFYCLCQFLHDIGYRWLRNKPSLILIERDDANCFI